MSSVKKIAITTDSSCYFTQSEAKEMGVHVLPMPFFIDGETYFENVTLTQENFYEMLKKDVEISTSQPSMGEMVDFWSEVLKEYDEIVHVPLASGLSRTYENACMYAKEPEFNGKVFVADVRRVAFNIKQSVYDAVKLVRSGKSAQEVKDYIEKTNGDCSCYFYVDTMKYLKKGGRVTAAAAAIGTLLNIKPILRHRGEKIEKFNIARGLRKAKDLMIATVKNELETEFKSYADAGEMAISVSYTDNEQDARAFVEELKELFPKIEIKFVDPLPLIIASHTGAGLLGMGCHRGLKD